jgi:hypothetical protein
MLLDTAIDFKKKLQLGVGSYDLKSGGENSAAFLEVSPSLQTSIPLPPSIDIRLGQVTTIPFLILISPFTVGTLAGI